MRNIKYALLLASILAFTAGPSFASTGLKANGSGAGAVTDINITGAAGTTAGFDGSTLIIPVLSSTLFAAGTANGGATSMATADQAVPVTYAFVRKQIPAFAQTGTLGDGKPGQMLTIYITGVGSAGSFTITPTTKTGFTTLVFTAAKQKVTLLFLDTNLGWVVISGTDAVVNIP